MQSSGSLDVSGYYKINNEISDTTSYKDITSKILSPLSQLVGAETSIFAVLKKTDDGLHAQNFISSSVDYKSSVNYEKYFQNNDPVLPHAYTSAMNNYRLGISKSFTFALDNIIDFQKFSRGQYYNEFLRPNSIRQILTTGIPSNTDASLVYVLGFHRYGNNAFRKKDAHISSYFGPILFNTLNNLALKTQLCDRDIIVSHLKKQVSDTGLTIVDDDYNIIFANHAGQSHFQINQNGSRQYSNLDRELVAELHSFISHMDQSSTKKVEFDHKGVKVVARMVISEIKSQTKRIILNSCRPLQTNIGSMEMEKYRLTQREMDISSLIVMGLTSPQISEKLCISIRTVENHLRSIYTKANVKNRTSLAYKLALPSHK